MGKYQALLEVYRKNPCRTLPNAFWKSALNIDQSNLLIHRDSDGALTSLELWEDSLLMAFWCADPYRIPPNFNLKKDFSLGLVHEDSLLIFENQQFSRKEAYFRLLHTGAPPIYQCPSGFKFTDVKMADELDLVVDFIRVCYQNIHVNEKIVAGWQEHTVYAPNLWIWIVDNKANQKAALGIAEFDHRVPEASLEWVQVHPAYQRKGLGKALVAELLRRVSGDAVFTTVSGEVNNRTNPETLYRRCGFLGSDVWWLLVP